MTIAIISPFDRFVAGEAIKQKVFHRVDEDKLPTQAAVCACPDCHQAQDYLGHLYLKGLELLHHVGVAGGPNALAWNSPAASLGMIFGDFVEYFATNRGHPKLGRLLKPVAEIAGLPLRADLFGFLQIYIGVDKKGLNSAPLMAHIPCAYATRYEIDLVHQLKNTVMAKKEIKFLFRDVKVPCLIHIDWGDNRRETWRFSAAEIAKWLKDNQIFFAYAKTRLTV